MTISVKNDKITLLSLKQLWGGNLLKRIFLVFILAAVNFVHVFSEDIKGIEYGNMKLGVTSHNIKLMNEADATPVYAEIKYKLSNEGNAIPYLKGDAGYSYIQGDTTQEIGISNMADSRYYSLGAGVDINDLSLEVAYENYQITPDDNENDNRMVLKFDYKY